MAQGRLLSGRDPVAVTAVQFLGAALAALPFSVALEGTPALPTGLGAVLTVAGLAAGGTLLPFTLFAYAQGRVSAEVAGAFLNLEPLVGAMAGVVVFGDPAGPQQLAGGAAILAGIVLSSLPLLATGRRVPAPAEERPGAHRPRGTRGPGARAPGPHGARSCRGAARGPGSCRRAARGPGSCGLAARNPGSRAAGIPLPGNVRHWRPPPSPARRAAHREPGRSRGH